MVGNSPVNETDLLGMNEVIVSGGCNPKRGGYDYRADWLLPDLGDKGVRWVFPDAGHDVNWKNFIISAEEEIKKRKIKLQDKEYIEWHVEYSSYILRAVNDGQPEKAYVDEVVALAKKHQVLLRWFNTKVEFAKNINSSIMGGERGPAGRISRITFFAHGFPGQINLTYPGVQLFIPRPPLLPDDDMKLTTGDLKSGYLSKSAFTDHAIGISCACRSATSTSGSGGDSFRDVWKDTFGFEFYASPTRTSYKDAKNPVPSEGGAWVPGPIPE
jgi:hypothetical protein